MSTKAIREALERLVKLDEGCAPGTLAALLEVQKIETAAKDMTRLNAGDFIYNIRDRERVMNETPDGQSTWDHPDVTAWGDAASLLAGIAKQQETP